MANFLRATKSVAKFVVHTHDRIVCRLGRKVYAAETVLLGLLVAPEATVKILLIAFGLWAAANLIRRWK